MGTIRPTGRRRRRRWMARGALALVVVALAINAAIPRFDCPPRPGADESAAIGRLQGIYVAERDFIAARAIDLDGDGRGEPGTFEELAGVKPLRGGGERLAVPLLSPSFSRVEESCVRVCGYLFHLELFAAPSDTGAIATEFRVDARPDPKGSTGRRLFYVDGRGIVMEKRGGDAWRPV